MAGRVLLTLVVGVLLCPPTSAQSREFELLGIGGAGGMFGPMVSPYDTNFMLISCDMSGSYRSTDGGKTWQMIHWSQMESSLRARPFFMPDGILWASREKTLKISRDKAVTWQPVVEGELPWNATTCITHIAARDRVYVVAAKGKDAGAWMSSDAGGTWTKIQGGTCHGLTILGTSVYLSTDEGFYVSRDLGKAWKKVVIPLAKEGVLRGPTGGTDKQGSTVLFGTVFGVGILKSTDKGESWTLSHGFHDRNDILMASNQTEIAYATPSGHRGARQVWRTLDGGDSWEQCFFMRGDKANVDLSWVQTDVHWGFYITHLGLGISRGDAKTVVLSTQGDFYISRDAGNTWKQAMNDKVGVQPGDPGFRYQCNGLEVTTNWRYLFDPFDDNRTYIAYTDIGFARSPDRGKTWVWSAKGCPWGNSFYHVVFDPFVKGRMYAATSGTHDIPYWGFVGDNVKGSGGVCVSDNHAVTWKVLGKGLPNRPATWMCIDPKSKEGALVFYTTVYGEGVYKSLDNGKTWVNKSKGLGNPGNMHAFMVEVHPQTGDVYCSITATRKGSKFPVPGGLWKSTDGGENWVDISRSMKLGWPCGFALNPDDPNVIYLTASTIPGSREGGLYKTTDGGKNWARVMRDETFAVSGPPAYVHANFVDLHPENPDYVYVGSNTHGIWFSDDAGTSWKRFDKLPFGRGTAVSFDPKDPKMMYVATHGGGVWRAHYKP